MDGQLVKENIKSLVNVQQSDEKMDIDRVDTFDSVPVLEQLALTEVG